MKLVEKRSVTLIEMMVVMFIIAILTAALAYNIGGGFQETKVRTTQISMKKLEDILEIEIAKDPQKAENIDTQWEQYVQSSNLVKDPKALIYDAWGNKFDVEMVGGKVKVSSEAYESQTTK